MTGRAENGFGDVCLVAPGLDLCAQLRSCLYVRPRGAVRARLAHRLVCVRRSEDPGRLAYSDPGKPLRIAGAVDALAVLHRDAREGRQRGRLPEHPLGQVRLEAQALPLAGAERAALVPDRIRHAESAEV